uniref:Zgc:193812 n=1 Tax=Hucho hucho TaxID=62062 RepID=A0A4W5JWG8_9TELE
MDMPRGLVRRILLLLQHTWATGCVALCGLNCSKTVMEAESQILTQSPDDTRRVTSSIATAAETRTTNKTEGLQKPSEQPSPSGPVARNKNGVVTISVHAKPGSKQNAITDVSIEAVGVAIAAPPTDGEANAELVRYLSKVLELKRSEVVLDKGSRSREKIINVTGSLTPEQVLDRLKQEASG